MLLGLFRTTTLVAVVGRGPTTHPPTHTKTSTPWPSEPERIVG